MSDLKIVIKFLEGAPDDKSHKRLIAMLASVTGLIIAFMASIKTIFFGGVVNWLVIIVVLVVVIWLACWESAWTVIEKFRKKDK